MPAERWATYYNKMKKILLTTVLVFILIDLHSQEFATIHFVNLKIYENNNELGIPNVKMNISSTDEECEFYLKESDINGNISFHVNPKREDFNSYYLHIQIPSQDTLGCKEKVSIVKFNEIGLFEPYEITKNIKIALTEYKILSEKEYKKHMKKYGLIPERKRRGIY
jgi:hypothetical protein